MTTTSGQRVVRWPTAQRRNFKRNKEDSKNDNTPALFSDASGDAHPFENESLLCGLGRSIGSHRRCVSIRRLLLDRRRDLCCTAACLVVGLLLLALVSSTSLGLRVRIGRRRPLDAMALLPEIGDAQPRKEGGVRIDREQVGEILRVLRGERVDGVVGTGLGGGGAEAEGQR
jgi:hypothetical protein